jgi:hypothetical protein
MNSDELMKTRATANLSCLGYSERQEVESYIDSLVVQAKKDGIKSAPTHQLVNLLSIYSASISVWVIVAFTATAFCFGLGLFCNVLGAEIAVAHETIKQEEICTTKMDLAQKDFDEKISKSEENVAALKMTNSSIIELCYRSNPQGN